MFRNRIKELREGRDLSRKDLAKILDVTDRAIGHYENGFREPSIDILIKLADYFDVTVDFILGRTENPEGVILNKGNTPALDKVEGDIEIEANRKTVPKQITEEMVKQIIEDLAKQGYELKKK